MNKLRNKKILLGVTGGIAAYKSAELIRQLRKEGAEVKVVMTTAATAFITPLTLQALSGNFVHTEMLSAETEAAMDHIALARWADIVLVAPASADFIARITYGHANDLLATLCLVTTAPIILAPAMNQQMWLNSITQHNVQQLLMRGIQIMGPAKGLQACGEEGPGRMLEPEEIVFQIMQQMKQKNTLANCHILITAGPTREAIDPVRYISNRSSGKMGYALAQAAVEAGAKVTLVSGPTALTAPLKVDCVNVITAEEMYNAVMKYVDECDAFISAAAVADYCVKEIAEQKIKKNQDDLILNLSRTPDILSAVAAKANRPVVVGFAAETENLLENAQKKLQDKKLDMIIANEVGMHKGFDVDENAVTIISANNQSVSISSSLKIDLARKIINLITKKFLSDTLILKT